jgi:hypothetical protein
MMNLHEDWGDPSRNQGIPHLGENPATIFDVRNVKKVPEN